MPSELELQEAVEEFQQYLADRVAPLMVADSVEILLQLPPGFLAERINAWAAGQQLTAPVADYLYHGAKKVSMMGEFDLVPKEALARYMEGLSAALLPHCPEGDRETLRQNLARLVTAAPQAPAATTAGVLHRQSGVDSSAPATPAPERALTREVRRLTLLLDHLRPLASPEAPAEQRAELASQFLATAARRASSQRDLDAQLAPLRELGIGTAPEQIFRTLAESLAGWVLPRVEGQQPSASREKLAAMAQVVSIAGDPAESGKRFRDLVHAAAEQFNEGHLGRAATMFELAERLVAEKKVGPSHVEPLRARGAEQLSEERLRKCAERTDTRSQLRTVMNFFTALQPQGLLSALDGEPARDRRHHLLALLEAHEADARAAAWDRLLASLAEGARSDPFFQMNLVYLLRIIPRPEGTSIDDEVNVVMKTSGRSSPPPLVKQVIAYLAATRTPRSERALLTYLKVFESMLLQPTGAPYPVADLETLLDRTCAALARFGTPQAWRALIDHGLKSEARLGSPFLRLAEAGRVDLSGSQDVVDRLIAAIRAELPRGGVLGFTARVNEDKIAGLLMALGGTPLPEVRAFLDEVATKHASRKYGQAAAKVLASLGAASQPGTASASLTGDLDLFGLPTLLQTISQSRLTGVLSLMGKAGHLSATLLIEEGQLRGGQAGHVRGQAAVYQLLERPFPGTFAFVARTDVAAQPGATPPTDAMSLLMEGVRRHDEFRQAAAVVPDDMRLAPTGAPHAAVEGEVAAFADHLWKLAAGRTPAECEAAIACDSYRVRRLLAHWVEQGALKGA